MICISIAQESRRMALVDMLNASRQCDLLEVRLDRFGKSPELGEILAHKPKPVIMSCRRPQDGGQWDGTEDERLTLLRQCIISKADYVEIELDVADQIRPFPPAQRVISYTNLFETPTNLADIYAEAQAKKPDVIKLTTLARTPEEAWPLVQILAKPAVPTVAVGLGKPGIMLTVLGRKIGAPWTYAALEKGMETHPGQPTVHDLQTIYHYSAIGRQTRLVGVTGFGERETATVAALNAAFAHADLPARCLPLGVGSVRLFRKIIDATKLGGLVLDPDHRRELVEIAGELEPAAEQARSADVLRNKGEVWKGYNTETKATMAALEEAVRVKFPGDNPLHGRVALVVGVNELARTVAEAIKERGAALVIASRDRQAAQALAQALECRFVQFEAIYSTMHDVLVVCDEEPPQGKSARPEAAGVHAGYLKPGMTVMDLTAGVQKTPLVREAALRGCSVVTPRQMLVGQIAMQAKLLAGKEVPREVLEAALPPEPEE
jgi:3-dehydroquinate dehydratase / shikimate dehydrogenase